MPGRRIAGVVACAVAGCAPRPPAAPDGERRLQARVEGVGSEVQRRVATAEIEATRAEQAVVAAQAAVRAGEADAALSEAEVVRRRLALARATEWRQVSARALALADADVAGVEVEAFRLRMTREARLKEWRFQTARTGYRMIVGSTLLMGGGFIGLGFGAAELVARPQIARHDPSLREEDRQADLRASNVRLGVAFAVGAPLMAAGVAVVLLGWQRLKIGRMAAAPGGLQIRF